MSKKLTYKLEFNPAYNPHQVDFLNLDTEVNLFSGAFGSGKSSTICVSIIMDAIKYPNNKCLIVRKKMVDLRKSTMKTFFDILPESSPIIKKWHKSSNELYLINGSEIWFGGVDNPQKWRSTEIGSCAIDEATEFSRSDFLFLQGRLRCKYAKKRVLYLACNPSHFEHWLYKDFYKKKIKNYSYVSSRSIDNKYLPKSVIDLYNSWKDINPDYYRRFVLGEWGLVEGVIYKNFSLAENVLDYEMPLIEYDSYGNVITKYHFYRAIDWGYKNPFVCLFIAIDNDDNIIVFDEFVETELTPIEAGKIIQSMHTDKHFINTYADPSEPASMAELNKLNLNVIPANNSVLDGIRMVMQKLPQIKLFPDCDKLREEFQNYKWMENKHDKNKPETPLKLNDHTMDALRYFCYTYFKSFGYAGLKLE